MKPMVCIGPPKPVVNPPPQGIRHCQKYAPGVVGAWKLNFIVAFGPEVHGDLVHRALFSAMVVGDPIGTLRPMPGMENVCPTEQVRHVSTARTVFPSIVSVPPIVPVTLPKNWLRAGVQPS